MTRNETVLALDALRDHIGALSRQEAKRTADYIALNPTDKNSRRQWQAAYNSALFDVLYAIKQLKKVIE